MKGKKGVHSEACRKQIEEDMRRTHERAAQAAKSDMRMTEVFLKRMEGEERARKSKRGEDDEDDKEAKRSKPSMKETAVLVKVDPAKRDGGELEEDEPNAKKSKNDDPNIDGGVQDQRKMIPREGG